MLTLAELAELDTVRRLNPEFKWRVFALMAAAHAAGIPLGIGTGWRTAADQLDQNGNVKPGFAAPGNSYHQSMPAEGQPGFTGPTPTALAADMVPVSSWDWMEPRLAEYGLRSGRHWPTSEPWHIQPIEIPGSRNFAVTPITLDPFPLPGDPLEEPVTEEQMQRLLAAIKQQGDRIIAQGQGHRREMRKRILALWAGITGKTTT